MRKLLYTLVLSIIVITSFSMPLEAQKPTSDGFPLPTAVAVTKYKDVSVASISSFSPKNSMAVVIAKPTVKVVPIGCADAKSCIYSHESGNNPAAVNYLGCYGLGQDCNHIVRAMCSTDYACQDTYFSGYAVRRYGSWDKAWIFWSSHRWW